MTAIVLHQFRFSHYNEKARWALDWKGLPHRRESHLPGPHIPVIRGLSGQTATPVMMLDGVCVAGSAAIIDALEQRYPQRPLYPQRVEARQEALSVQSRFDTEVGPAVRTALFSVILDEPGYLTSVFGQGAPTARRIAYRAMVPLLRDRIARFNGVSDPENVRRSFAIAGQALDWVAERARATGYLVGEEFSVADLACAALLAPLVQPQHPDMHRPEPAPPAVQEFLARWAGHPGAAWVLRQYAEHRPPPQG